MDNDRAALEHSFNEQRRSKESNIIIELLDRQSAFGRKRSRAQSKVVLQAREKVSSSTRSYKFGIIVFALYTSLVIAAGVLLVCFTTPKPRKTCQQTYKRTMNSTIMASSQPQSVAVADFNNDHHMDIVVANTGTNTMGIFLSMGNDTFGEQQTYSTGTESWPYSIVVSDFNHDSYVDIAVANYATNNIGIFLGNGNGTFNDQTVFSLGSSHPLFVTVGDFNKDHQMDIAVVNYGTNNVGILLGHGNGSFQNQVTYSTGYDSIPYSLAVGDFNNDTKLDIAVTNYGTNNIGIFFGYGNGTFANQIIYTTNSNSHPSSIAIGDFNHDNQTDIVVSNYGTGNIGIFLSHGNGSLLPQRTYSIGFNTYPQYISVGDFNKDNELDIVVVDARSDRIHILPGYGNGSFASITTYDTISGSSPFWIAISDFNNDTQSDIVVANYNSNNVLVLNNYSSKPSVRPTIYHNEKQRKVVSFAVSDFNNDHILDIAAVLTDNIFLLIGSGGGTFSQGATYSTGEKSFPQYVCAGDLNNDSRTDIISAQQYFSNVGVFLGHGDGTFSNMTPYSTGINSRPWWIALGDVNNDNSLDIVSANTNSNTIGILLGNGDGTFATVMAYFIGKGSNPYSVAVGHINNDRYLDLVVVNGNNSITVLLGYGNGSFIVWNVFPTSPSPWSSSFVLALADFNNDSYLDIAVTNTYTDNIGVFLGYGNGTFTAQTAYSTGSNSQPFYVIVADFNNDTICDLAVSNFGSNEIVIFYGYGNGNFTLARTYPTGYNSKPYGITTVDLDNNNQLEIVAALWGTGDIAVLTEYNAAQFVHQTIYPTGSAVQPFSVAVGDINNDNRSDIVVANSGTDNLGILFGADNGTFDMKMIYSINTPSHPQYVITCDINKDNHLDIVSVNSKNNSISVMIGDGNGVIAKQLLYSTGDSSYPYAIAADDLNNDTYMDLVVANEGADSIGIFFGFNYTSFQNQMIYSSIDGTKPTGIVVSDFNNDHFLDIATVFQDSDCLGILLGYGNGSFTSMMLYLTGNSSKPQGIAVGDFNKDNRLDIVVANWGTSNIGILLGYGNGNFAPIVTYSHEHDFLPYGVAVADFNKDGQSDIVVANYKADNIAVLCGYYNGSFSITKIYPTGEGSTPRVVTTGDFDNDGNLDITVANSKMNNIGVLLGHGDGTFENQTAYTTGFDTQPFWVTVDDLNNDGQLDIVTANWNMNNVGILYGHGNGSFVAVKGYSTGNGSLPRCVRVVDFNNDNISDIAIANSGTDDIVVLFGVGDGNFLLGTPYSTGTKSSPVGLVIADFNNDSQLDIAVVNNGADNIGVFLGNGSQPFGSLKVYTTGAGSRPHSVAVNDLDNDGWSDIVVANYGNDSVGIFLSSRDGALQDMKSYSTGIGSAPYSVAIADFNSDHYFDIVVTNSETDSITILLGYVNGTFAIGMTYSTGSRSRPYTVVTGDFNDDNISDIAIANSGTNNIFFLYGYGNGTFGNKYVYPLGYGYRPYSLVAKDLNHDNWLDIVIACYNTDHVEILLQIC